MFFNANVTVCIQENAEGGPSCLWHCTRVQLGGVAGGGAACRMRGWYGAKGTGGVARVASSCSVYVRARVCGSTRINIIANADNSAEKINIQV